MKTFSRETMALRVADTLSKARPITPVILAPFYMRATSRTLRHLADKIVSKQVPAARQRDKYLYSESVKKKMWAMGRR